MNARRRKLQRKFCTPERTRRGDSCSASWDRPLPKLVLDQVGGALRSFLDADRAKTHTRGLLYGLMGRITGVTRSPTREGEGKSREGARPEEKLHRRNVGPSPYLCVRKSAEIQPAGSLERERVNAGGPCPDGNHEHTRAQAHAHTCRMRWRADPGFGVRLRITYATLVIVYQVCLAPGPGWGGGGGRGTTRSDRMAVTALKRVLRVYLVCFSEASHGEKMETCCHLLALPLCV